MWHPIHVSSTSHWLTWSLLIWTSRVTGNLVHRLSAHTSWNIPYIDAARIGAAGGPPMMALWCILGHIGLAFLTSEHTVECDTHGHSSSSDSFFPVVIAVGLGGIVTGPIGFLAICNAKQLSARCADLLHYSDCHPGYCSYDSNQRLTGPSIIGLRSTTTGDVEPCVASLQSTNLRISDLV